MPITLPSPYRSNDVIPYAPNAPGDRGHTWDWPGHSDTIPSGITVSGVDATQGTEIITLRYVGLTRSEARTLEAFVEAKKARKTAFWCPTFQHDFYRPLSQGVGGNVVFRDWGFYDNIYPLTISNGGTVHWPYHLAVHWGGSWALLAMNGNSFRPGTFDSPTGAELIGYNLEVGAGNVAGDSSIATGKTSLDGAVFMRLLWVRFADDAMTTEWDHPHLANITLRVQHARLETPNA